jgi:hypothetical protein
MRRITVMNTRFLTPLSSRGGKWTWLVGLAVAAGLVAYWQKDAGVTAADEAQKSGQAALPADLDLVPRDGFLFFSFRVADYWGGEGGKARQAEIAKLDPRFLETLEKAIGLKPEQIERVTVVGRELERSAPFFLVTTAGPLPRDKVLQAIAPEAEELKHQGRTYYASRAHRTAIHFISDRIFLTGTGIMMPEVLDGLAAKNAVGPLSGVLRLAAQKHLITVGLNPASVVKQIESTNLPAQAEPFLPLLKTQLATLTLDQGEETKLDVRLTYSNADAAKDAEKAIQAAVALGRQLASKFLKTMEQVEKEDKSNTFMWGRLVKMLEPALKTVQVRQHATEVQVTAHLKADLAALNSAVVGLTLKSRESAQRVRSANNMRQLAIAMHNYHDTHGRFPPAVVYSQDGKPLYSWRILLLPYVEQEKLYKEFNLEEPWDSEHNKTLLAKMPEIYAPTGTKTKEPFTTFYQVFYGPGAAFEGKEGKRIPHDFQDGTSNTILFAEAGEPVPWTKPVDLPYAADKPLPKLGGLLPDLPSLNVAMADGSVRSVNRTVSEKTLRAAITPNGGEILGSDF